MLLFWQLVLSTLLWGKLYAVSVIWHAPFYSGGGYCSEAFAFVKALRAIDVDVKMVHHGDSVQRDFLAGLASDERELLKTESISEWEAQQLAPSSVVVCHSEPGAWHPPRYHTSRCPPTNSLFVVGRTMFETDRLPTGWADRLNKMDEVWVPTVFHREIFASGGVSPDKLRVIGESVDTAFYDPALYTPYHIQDISPSTLVFLSVFKWEKRKGWDVLLRAYFEEFAPTDDVALVILTSAYHSASDFHDRISAYAQEMGFPSMDRLPRVTILPHIKQEDLPRVYKRADLFVLPSRGEGWGRPHVEALSMGLPVAATNWSGPTEYLTESNGYPIQVSNLVPVGEGPFKEHYWAEPSLAHVRQILRHAVTHREELAHKGKQGREDMVAKYSPAQMGLHLRMEMDRIADLLDRHSRIPHKTDEL